MVTELSRLEGRLTLESRSLVRRYVRNCNEEPFASILLSAFDEYKGQPLSNAFYLHELVELESFREEGHDFVDVDATPEFRELRARIYDTNREPHLEAAELHCKYLHLKAEEVGYDVSLGTIIEFDPMTSRQDKDDLFARHPTLKVVESEKDIAKNFFKSLVKAEKLLFYQSFSLANSDMYMDAASGR